MLSPYFTKFIIKTNTSEYTLTKIIRSTKIVGVNIEKVKSGWSRNWKLNKFVGHWWTNPNHGNSLSEHLKRHNVGESLENMALRANWVWSEIYSLQINGDRHSYVRRAAEGTNARVLPIGEQPPQGLGNITNVAKK